MKSGTFLKETCMKEQKIRTGFLCLVLLFALLSGSFGYRASGALQVPSETAVSSPSDLLFSAHSLAGTTQLAAPAEAVPVQISEPLGVIFVQYARLRSLGQFSHFFRFWLHLVLFLFCCIFSALLTPSYLRRILLRYLKYYHFPNENILFMEKQDGSKG